jgi:hypothetical protein
MRSRVEAESTVRILKRNSEEFMELKGSSMMAGNATTDNRGQTYTYDAEERIAFRGLMTCAYDDCMVTGEIQKEKYVYYRCTGHRGKCDLPRFREEDIANRLGQPLKGLQVPPDVVSQIVATLREDQKEAGGRLEPNGRTWKHA